MSVGRRVTSEKVDENADSGVWRVEPRERRDARLFALHDAKNMACALTAGVEWLRGAGASANRAERQDALDGMAEACRALSKLLVQSLRSERGGDDLELRLRTEWVGQVVRSAARRAKRRAALAGVSICVEASSEFSSDFDPELVGRLLDNLLDNALKFSPQGSRISIEFGRFGDSTVI